MDLIAYTLGMPPTEMRPAARDRAFMDGTAQRYAYRCLPLNIANQHGWELLSPCTVECTWDGGPSPDAMVVDVLEDGWPVPVSHFGHGVLTFHINQLFRTPPGVHLMVTGPINTPKDGATALSGIMETDWSHYTFTMNWVLTRPFHPVRFHKGEPFAHIFPVSLPQVEQVQPQFRPIESEPGLQQAYNEWMESRNQFNEDLNKPDSEAQRQKWQKGYFQGIGPDGCPVRGFEHRTKLDVKPWPKQRPPKSR